MLRRFFLILLLAASLPLAAAEPVPKPGAKDLCPVCGMLVSKYPNWVAVVLWKDGHAHFFDGAKDLFKFLQSLDKYAKGHRAEDIKTIAVTDFYGLQRINAQKAWFVTGSDVLGPMGHELVPLETQADADDFMKDHKGRKVLRFKDVTPAVVQALDQ